MVSLRMFLRLGLCVVTFLSLVYDLSAQTGEERTKVIKLWSQGKPAFGIAVPNEREEGVLGSDGEPLPPLYTQVGGERLAQNELLDLVFLDLQTHYDLDAVTAIASGLESGYDEKVGEISLCVRIPAIWREGEEAARQRIAECFEAGADGVVIPYIRSTEMARTAVRLFTEIGADVWSPQNPDGTVISWLMIEDPWALADVEEIANIPGISVLACGVGSLGEVLGGNRQAAEAGNQVVLEHTKRVGIPNATFAEGPTAALRVLNGFLGVMFFGPDANRSLRIAYEASGRGH